MQATEVLETDSLRVRQDAKVLFIELNRPRKYNALDTGMVLGLTDVLQSEARQQTSRAVVISGAGRAFAAGADIAEYAGADRQAFALFTERANVMCSQIASMPVPVIAAVNGLALGGGFELVLSCDIVFASHDASFGLPETGLGLIPGWGGTQRLAHHIGPNRAKELIMTGARLSAQDAHRLGIVNRLHDPENLLEAAAAFAAVIASGPGKAIGAAKRAINAGHASAAPTGPGFLLEQAELRALFETEDGREGIAAFVEKRPADFTGN